MSSIIYDPFVVTNLPRLPPKSDVSKLCFTSQINDSNSSNFDISISGSYIATFITRPSPKMIWSYALSPQAVVSAMDSFDFEANNNNNNNRNYNLLNDKKLFAIGIKERKKNKLKFISYGLDDNTNSNNTNTNNNGNNNNVEEENQSSSISVTNEEDKHSNDLENIKQVKDKSISIDDQIVGLKFSKNSKFVYAISSNGNINIWNFSINENIEENELINNEKPILSHNIDSLVNSNKNIIYHKFLKPEEMKVDSRNEKIEYLLLTIETSSSLNKENSIIIRIFSLNSNEILEIQHSKISNISKLDNIQFTYDISGKLIILESKKLILRVYELPMLENEQIIKISGVFLNEPKNSPTSIMCASTNRILVTKGSTVALIDIQYESLLSSLDLYSRSKEQNNKPARNATLLNVPIVNGNTLRSKKTFALLVLKNTKENYSQIQYISIDVGLGKLRDALISLPEENSLIEEKQNFTSFPCYFSKFNKIIEGNEEVENLNKNVIKNNQELSNIYKKLFKLKQLNDLESLENHLIAYLKNRSYESIFEDNEFKVYEYEKDRFVDAKFFKLITLLLFDYKVETDSIELNEENIPESGLTYILTHPLFPIQYAHGLLKILEISPRLQRQAIVTCVNIPCKDFILELSRVENDEIFKDIINRLIDEFSSEEITLETIKIMKQQKSNEINSNNNNHNNNNNNNNSNIKYNNFDLDKIINKIIKLNYGYEILNAFIDSNGLVLSLHYTNDDEQLNKLINQTQRKVKTLMDDTLLLTLVNQTLSNVDIEKIINNKNKKKNQQLLLSDNTNIEVETNKMDMMLKVGGKDSQMSKKGARVKVAPYTIDRLTI
ncbi:hypothetical protein C6P40_005368 [Pichia californica]|uniref:Uncharacterized protein n=1 Tax=Pichia californica TaxID=460514 RepID=A0A9P6WLR9_9ASCO|nr:hypothetical protein C6P42_001612 [[Candida] californica]KAG0689234.1 hypothetical protein C6P40_005368 [[Candida] californica]